MKHVIHLKLPSFASRFCGRRTSVMACEARRRGNAAGLHGGKAKYGTRDRRLHRLEERSARLNCSK